MARTVEEIKRGMTGVFIQNETIRSLYELTPGRTFEEEFSRVSLESILFYVVATGIWVLEKIFDTHRQEVTEIIENILPHRPKWYRDKALSFLLSTEERPIFLFPDTDRFDITGMTDEQIEQARVVKYATAIEEPGSSVLIIKIATGEPGDLQPLPPEQAVQFQAYINEIRDAGVRWNLVNQEGDNFRCTVDVFYSPLLAEVDVRRAVLNAIRGYITGLPFNGEYSNMALIDAVQQFDGVLIAELRQAFANNTLIDIKTVPAAGYFIFNEENITLNLTPHNAVLQ